MGDWIEQIKVSHSSKKPILMGISRIKTPWIPLGPTTVNIGDGKTIIMNFVKIACNKSWLPGDESKTNMQHNLFRLWFGEDAGHPGRRHFVMLEKREGQYYLYPRK